MGMHEEGATASPGATAGEGAPSVRAASQDGKATSPDATAPLDEGGFSLPVAGLGVDIVSIERMQRVLARTPRFKTRVYTDGEQAYCDAYKKKAHLHYATHFAAKEAVAKALGTGFAEGVAPRDIEVTHDDNGRPHVVLHGKARELADEQGVLEMHLSLSRTHETAVANALAATKETRPQPKEEAGPSPREELAAEFKRLRGMLDNLEDALATGLADLDDAPPPEADEAVGEEGAAGETLGVEEAAAPSDAPAPDAPHAADGETPAPKGEPDAA